VVTGAVTPLAMSDKFDVVLPVTVALGTDLGDQLVTE
jgi:hypothetical protein